MGKRSSEVMATAPVLGDKRSQQMVSQYAEASVFSRTNQKQHPFPSPQSTARGLCQLRVALFQPPAISFHRRSLL